MTVYHDMSSSYIKLEKEYFKKASKRIQYEFNSHLKQNPDTKEINLSTAQYMLTRALGFRNTDSLITALDKKEPLKKEQGVLGILQFWNSEKISSLFHFLLELNNNDEHRYIEQAKLLITTVINLLVYMRDQDEILFDTELLNEYLQLEHLVKLHKTRRDFPSKLRHELWSYLRGLPGMGSNLLGAENNNSTKEHHQRIVTELLYPISVVSQIVKYNALIISPEWYHTKYNNYHVQGNNNQKIEYKEHTERLNPTILEKLYTDFSEGKWDSIINEEFTDFGVHDYMHADKTIDKHLFRGIDLIYPIKKIPWLEDSWLVDRQYKKIIKGLLRTKQLQNFHISDLMLYAFEIVNTQKRDLHFKFIRMLLNNYGSVIKQSQQLCSI